MHQTGSKETPVKKTDKKRESAETQEHADTSGYDLTSTPVQAVLLTVLLTVSLTVLLTVLLNVSLTVLLTVLLSVWNEMRISWH